MKTKKIKLEDLKQHMDVDTYCTYVMHKDNWRWCIRADFRNKKVERLDKSHTNGYELKEWSPKKFSNEIADLLDQFNSNPATAWEIVSREEAIQRIKMFKV